MTTEERKEFVCGVVKNINKAPCCAATPSRNGLSYIVASALDDVLSVATFGDDGFVASEISLTWDEVNSLFENRNIPRVKVVSAE